MPRFSAILIAGLATAASAMPGMDLFQRAACNRDNCLRAIVASQASPGPSKGSADCSAFMTATVTPCPVTTTLIATPVTITSTASASVTSISTISTSSISVISVTVTSYYLATITTFPARKRSVELEGFEKRTSVVAAVCSTTSRGTVPAYASACSGTARYSSACACDGITASTKTLAPVTISSTSTPTVTTTTTLTSSIVSITTAIQTIFSTTTETANVASATVTVAADQFDCASYVDKQVGCSDGSTCYSHPSCFDNTASSDQCYQHCSDTNCIYLGQVNQACLFYYDCCQAPATATSFNQFSK